jgi:hypothetical protein
VPRRWGIAAAALLLCAAGTARAEEPAPPEPGTADPAPAAAAPTPDPAPAAAAPASYPKNYVTVLVGTTMFARPKGGPTDSLLADVSPGIGYGRLVTPKIAIELDISPTIDNGEYLSTSLIPGVVWNFSTYVYAAARFLVPIDPDFNVGAFPGIGAFYGLPSGLGFSLELNAGAYFAADTDPTVATFLTLGALYAF